MSESCFKDKPEVMQDVTPEMWFGLQDKVTELEADLLTAGEIIIDLTNASEAFNEAIQFALETDKPKTFLSYWNEGEWAVLRRYWSEFTIHKSLNEELK